MVKRRDTHRWPRALLCAFGLLPILSHAGALPLWEVQGRANRVAILGSIHFLRPGEQELAPAILRAYEQADFVIMEIDLDDLDPGAAQATTQRLGMDPHGRTLDQLLGERAYAVAQSRAREISLDLDALRPFEPWIAAIMVTQLQLGRLGFDAQAGVEQQLLRLAGRDRKEIRGLETLEQQLIVMDRLSARAQRDFLLEALDEAAGMEQQIEVIVSAWAAGDTATLEREFLGELRGQRELYERLVIARNRAWARQLAPLLEGERRDILVVVGALHLVGPDSLIDMLGRAGFTPRQWRTGEVTASGHSPALSK